MITYNVVDYEIREGGKKVEEISGSCLAADTKPTEGVANGSVLTEMDTGKIYMFDEAGSQWIEFGE